MNWMLLGGSLIAVLVTAGLVAWLGLGRDGRIDEAGAARLAEELLIDFDAEDAFVDSGGASALVRGRNGDFALLRLHGAHPVARRLSPPLGIRRDGERFWIASGEARFGETAIRDDRLLTLL